MKRVKYILLALLATIAVQVVGNIIITTYMPSKILVKIDNLKDYSDMLFVGLGDYSTFSASGRVEMIDSSSYMDAVMINPIAFHAVKKTYLKKTNIDRIDWKKDKNVIKSSISVNANALRSDKSNVESVEIHLNIAGFDKKSMVMYESARTIKYNDGSPDLVKYFDYKGDLSKLRKTF